MSMSMRPRPRRTLFTLLTMVGLGVFGCDNSDIVATRIGDGHGDGGGNAGASAGGAGGSADDAGTGGDGGSYDPDSGLGDGASNDSDSGSRLDGGADAGDGSAEPSPNCDDGNPCTVDSFTAGNCQHDPVPDGRRCEDGDFCTLGDACLSGDCVPGATQTGSARELGRFEGYGSVGAAATPGDDRFLFADETGSLTRLTQARVVGGVLQTQGSLDVPVSFFVGAFFDPPLLAAWGDLAAVADSDSSIVLNGDPRPIFLVSVSPTGGLSARGSLSLDSDPMITEAIAAMTGRGTRLFVCTNYSVLFSEPIGTLHWIDVSNPDAPVQVAKGSLGSQCGSVAANELGTRLYVNTANGVRFTDLTAWSGSGDLTFATDPVVPTDSSLHVRGDKLLARSGMVLHVLDETTHAELSSFTVAGARAAALSDAGVFVEGDRLVDTGSEYFVALYSLAGDLLHERTVTRFGYVHHIPVRKLAVGAEYAMGSLDHQIFRVTSGGFELIEEPAVGNFSYVYAGDAALHVRGFHSAHRIAVTNPSSPTISAGGPHRYPAFGIKLDESLNPAMLIPEANQQFMFLGEFSYNLVEVSTTRGHTDSTRIERVIVDQNERYVSQGFIDLPGGNAKLLSAGEFLYRAEALAAGGVHVQRWFASDLRAGVTAPAFDLTVGTDVVTRFGFDVDPNARVAVVTTGPNIHWLDLSGTSPLVTTTTPAAPPDSKVKVRGHRVAYSTGSAEASLVFAERDTTDEQVSPAVGDFIQDVLAYDGTIAYLTVRRTITVIKRGVPADQAVITQLPMRTLPTSLVAMDDSLVAGSESQVLTFAPQCE